MLAAAAVATLVLIAEVKDSDTLATIALITAIFSSGLHVLAVIGHARPVTWGRAEGDATREVVLVIKLDAEGSAGAEVRRY